MDIARVMTIRHRLRTALQTARNLLPDLFGDGSETTSAAMSSR